MQKSKLNQSQILCSVQDEAIVVMKDLRKYVRDTSIHPYSSIGKIISNFYCPERKQYIQKVGTGSIIGQRWILTSAHVIYLKVNIQSFAQNVYFDPPQSLIPGQIQCKCRSDQSHIHKSIRVIKAFFNSEYLQKKQKQPEDFVLLLLQQNDIIKSEQILRINFSYDFKKQKDQMLKISGYTSSQNFSKIETIQVTNQIKKNFNYRHLQLQEDKEGYKLNGDFLQYFHTTQQGTSGSPILMKNDKEQYEIIGIHKGTSYKKNVGILITTICTQISKCLIQVSNLSDLIQSKKLQSNWKNSIIIFKQDERQILKLNETILQKDLNINRLKQQVLSLQKQQQVKNKEMQMQIEKLNTKYHQTQKEVQNQKLKNFMKSDPYLSEQVKCLATQTACNQHNKKRIEQYLCTIFGNQQGTVKSKYCTAQQFQQKSSIFTIKVLQRISKIKLSKDLFWLKHQGIKISMKNLLSDKNWNHLEYLNLSSCEINDDGWIQFIKNAHFFVNLKWLIIYDNMIQNVKKQNLKSLFSLGRIQFSQTITKKNSDGKDIEIIITNPLSIESEKELQLFKQSDRNIIVIYKANVNKTE